MSLSQDSSSDDSDEHDDGLDEPYTQSIAFEEDDDSDASEELDNFINCREKPKKKKREGKREPIRPGDVIEYYNPIFVYGDERGLRHAAVIEVDPDKEPFKLKLSNGESLYDDVKIRRIKTLESLEENEDNSLHNRKRSSSEKHVFVDHPGIIRPINGFKLRKAVDVSLPSFVHDFHNQASRAKRIIQKNMNQLREKCESSGFAPLDLLQNGTSTSTQERKYESDSDSLSSMVLNKKAPSHSSFSPKKKRFESMKEKQNHGLSTSSDESDNSYYRRKRGPLRTIERDKSLNELKLSSASKCSFGDKKEVSKKPSNAQIESPKKTTDPPTDSSSDDDSSLDRMFGSSTIRNTNEEREDEIPRSSFQLFKSSHYSIKTKPTAEEREKRRKWETKYIGNDSDEDDV